MHFFGKSIFSISFLNPSLILLAYLLFALLYLKADKSKQYTSYETNIVVSFLIGFLTIAAGYNKFKEAIDSLSVFDSYSDILTQLITQANWFLNGIFPYQEVSSPNFFHKPFPVYMPLHWGPLTIAIKLNHDVRWIGFFALAFAYGLWGIFYFRRTAFSIFSIINFFIPSLVFLSFMYKDKIYAVTIETLIVSYYLILLLGLLSKNNLIIAIGISLCLLSRYTLLFWMPLFAIVFYFENSKMANIKLWLIVLFAVLFIYVIPFLSHDTSIFLKGISYHNKAVVDEIRGYGTPLTSYTFLDKIHFAEFFKSLINSSDYAYTAKVIRAIQLGVMFLVNIIGLVIYFSFRKSFDANNFLAVFLIIFLAMFFLFSPLTYFYYLMTPLFLTGFYISYRNIVSKA